MSSGMTLYPTGGSSYSPSTLTNSLLNRGIGFQNQFKFFEELLSATQSKFPPYDILSTDENEYEIRFAVAGFKKSDIEIQYANKVLTVKGNKDDDSDDAYFHKGIANRAFTQSFPLAEHVEVTSATLEDGILTIKLVRELPDELQPRTIKIK